MLPLFIVLPVKRLITWIAGSIIVDALLLDVNLLFTLPNLKNIRLRSLLMTI